MVRLGNRYRDLKYGSCKRYQSATEAVNSVILMLTIWEIKFIWEVSSRMKNVIYRIYTYLLLIIHNINELYTFRTKFKKIESSYWHRIKKCVFLDSNYIKKCIHLQCKDVCHFIIIISSFQATLSRHTTEPTFKY